jgi:hypothetical protein
MKMNSDVNHLLLLTEGIVEATALVPLEDVSSYPIVGVSFSRRRVPTNGKSISG